MKHEYAAGGKLTIVLEDFDVECLCADGDLFELEIQEHQIVGYEPPAFDWKDAKPGMAFCPISYEPNKDNLYIYIGPDMTDRNLAVFQSPDSGGTAPFIAFYKWLVRYPDLDIKF